LPKALLTRLHLEARAERWQVTRERFAIVLSASAAKALGTDPKAADVETYLCSLHLADLALACACADGHAEAWEHFIREHRQGLYRAADAMYPGGGRELADSLYADLYGVSARQGERRSVFRYFHGRASLTTWLRAVLAQRMVDRARATRKLDPLPEDDTVHALPHPAPAPDPEWARWVTAVRRALSAGLQTLADRDRLRLGLYYTQELTLAQIGRMLGEHEATVSRHLTRARLELRDAIARFLREQEGMSPATAAECLESVLRDAGALDLRDLIGASGDRKESGRERSQ
jgi:RNA polymerase sigma-70 factor (ECF subfamily)